jgi:TrmH RNA methyltransferase
MSTRRPNGPRPPSNRPSPPPAARTQRPPRPTPDRIHAPHAPHAPHGPPSPPPSEESVVYGLNAALALARHRPSAIQRVLYQREVRDRLGPLLKATAAARRPYREVTADDLGKVARTTHHEGVVVVAAPLPLTDFEALLERTRPDALLVALDDVGNPHNLGAILRSAAYFGAAGLLVPHTERQAMLSPAAVRIAQGGAEVVPVCGVPDLGDALRRLAARGIVAVAADTRGGQSAARFAWPAGVCIVMGNEGVGLAAPARAACAQRVTIPGTGEVESLNVAVAAGVLLALAAARRER